MSKVKDYIGTLVEGDNGYNAYGSHWDASTIRDSIKELKPFDFNLMSIDIGIYPWKFSKWNLSEFLYHLARIEKVDISYPIVLSPDGYIIDGWHRVCRAIMEGRDTIKAVRLFIMPEPDQIEIKDD